MNLQESIDLVNSKFTYVPDGKIDDWSVMDLDKMQGDCEDYSLTVIWNLCNQSKFKFFLFFLLIPRYQVWYVKSKNGGHAVGYANGLWFDNWTRKPMPWKEFQAATGHKRVFPWLPPISWLKMFVGMLIKTK